MPASTASAQVVAPTPTPTPVVTAGGGVGVVPVASSPASVARLACAQRCGTAGAVRPGSVLRVRGKTLSRTDQVVFMGVDGEADNVAATPAKRRKTSVDVRVPFGAAGGPVAVVDRDGARSVPSVAPVAIEATPLGAGPTVEFAARSPRYFYGSEQPATLTYVVHGAAPVDVGRRTRARRRRRRDPALGRAAGGAGAAAGRDLGRRERRACCSPKAGTSSGSARAACSRRRRRRAA